MNAWKLFLLSVNLIVGTTLNGQVRFDGIYRASCTYEDDEQDGQELLRFYPNGRLIKGASGYCDEATSELMNGWFSVKEIRRQHNYFFDGDSLKFTITAGMGSVDYYGRVLPNDTIQLKIKSHINGYEGYKEYYFSSEKERPRIISARDLNYTLKTRRGSMGALTSISETLDDGTLSYDWLSKGKELTPEELNKVSEFYVEQLDYTIMDFMTNWKLDMVLAKHTKKAKGSFSVHGGNITSLVLLPKNQFKFGNNEVKQFQNSAKTIHISIRNSLDLEQSYLFINKKLVDSTNLMFGKGNILFKRLDGNKTQISRIKYASVRSYKQLAPYDYYYKRDYVLPRANVVDSIFLTSGQAKERYLKKLEIIANNGDRIARRWYEYFTNRKFSNLGLKNLDEFREWSRDDNGRYYNDHLHYQTMQETYYELWFLDQLESLMQSKPISRYTDMTVLVSNNERLSIPIVFSGILEKTGSRNKTIWNEIYVKHKGLSGEAALERARLISRESKDNFKEFNKIFDLYDLAKSEGVISNKEMTIELLKLLSAIDWLYSRKRHQKAIDAYLRENNKHMKDFESFHKTNQEAVGQVVSDRLDSYFKLQRILRDEKPNIELIHEMCNDNYRPACFCLLDRDLEINSEYLWRLASNKNISLETSMQYWRIIAENTFSEYTLKARDKYNWHSNYFRYYVTDNRRVYETDIETGSQNYSHTEYDGEWQVFPRETPYHPPRKTLKQLWGME